MPKRETRHDWNGRDKARRLYPKLGACESCGAPATDRHHRDGNTHNNARKNVAELCRRCHMRADGRLETVRSWPKRKPFPPRHCMGCNQLKPGHFRLGLCNACDHKKRRGTLGEPCAAFHEAKERTR